MSTNKKRQLIKKSQLLKNFIIIYIFSVTYATWISVKKTNIITI